MSTVGFLIFSEAVIVKVIVSPTLAIVVLSLLDVMVTLSSSGAVVSIVKEFTERLSLVLLLSLVVTLILQLL